MKKFVEVKGMIGKIGWETEACYEVLRTAENEEGRLILVENNGMFDESAEGTCEVSISLHATGDFKNFDCLTREEADKIFESYL
jgi:hypothetical protein